MYRHGVWILLLACTSEPVSCEEPAAEWLDPTADDDWSALIEGGSVEPPWSAVEVGAELERALQNGLPTAQPVLADYRELLSHGDTDCPGDEFVEGFAVVGSCESEEGYIFTGAAGLATTDTRVYAEDGSWTGLYTVITAPADYVITRPDGSALSAGGTLLQSLSRDSVESHWNSSIAGTWFDSAGTVPWLQEGFSGDLSIDGRQETTGTFLQVVRGGATLLGASLLFDELSIAPSDCADGIWAGSISIRQSNGAWYRLDFDEHCSTCGQLYDDDEQEMGELCIDPAPFFEALTTASAE